MRACALTDVRKNDLGDFVIVSQKMVVCAMFCVGCLGDLIPVLSALAPPLPSSVSLLRLPSVNEREIKLIPDKNISGYLVGVKQNTSTLRIVSRIFLSIVNSLGKWQEFKSGE